MKKKGFILLLIGIFILTYALLWVGASLIKAANPPKLSGSLEIVKTVGSQIIASGQIRSTNEAVLTFQTGGRLVYLPFKDGDSVFQGATIASLDTYDLQRQLQTALNNYQIQRDTFDQAQANNQSGVLQGSQNYNLQVLNTLKPSGDTDNNIINDMAKRILDQNQQNLNNSVINVEIANYALQLANLTAPFSGILIHEDVTSPYVNVTPTTTFTLVDPKAYVFRANVDASSIDFIKIGANATITLSGMNKKFQGTVERIYPTLITLPTGDQVYQVDIYSQSLLASTIKYDQIGSVVIHTTTARTDLVPSYLVAGNNYLWIDNNGKSELKNLNIGQSHDNLIEVTSGIPTGTKLIENPKDIINQKYLIP